MTTGRIALLLAAAWIGQTTVVRIVAGDGAPVDLVLIAVVYAALSRGAVVGLWTGTIGGLVQDALSGGIIGVSGLAKTIIGVLVGLAGSQFIIGTVWHRMLIVAVASMTHAFCFLGVYALVGSGVPGAGVGFVLIQALVNALVGLVAELVVRLAPGMFERFRQGHSGVARRHWIMG